jgi:GT2 family glycosyltransferase
MQFEVIIPTYRNAEELEACLQALKSQSEPGFRVWVCIDDELPNSISNQSTLTAAIPNLDARLACWGGSSLLDAEWGFQVRWLTHPDGRNHGSGPTRNLALPYLSLPYTLFLDSDIRPAPNWIAEWRFAIEAQGQVASAWLGAVVYTNKLQDPWARYLATRGRAKFKAGDKLPPLYFNTQNALVKTECLLSVAGFDERLPGYGGDDSDLGHRMGKLPGFTLRYCPQAAAFTENDKSLPQALAQLEGLGAQNLRYLYQKDSTMAGFYKVGWMAGKGAGGIVLRVLFNPLFWAVGRWLANSLAKHCPTFLLHYLAVGSVYRGFKGKQPPRNRLSICFI